MIECTECGNVRIRKLNEIRRQRRINSSGSCKVLDSKEEELVLNISPYIFHPNSPMHIRPDSNEASGSNTIELGTRPNEVSQLEDGEDGADHLEGAKWNALINSHSQFPDPKSDYVDYSEIGPAFKLQEAPKNIHKLDPTVIPSTLKQMAHCRVFILFSMFTTQSLQMIHDNIGDLYKRPDCWLANTSSTLIVF